MICAGLFRTRRALVAYRRMRLSISSKRFLNFTNLAESATSQTQGSAAMGKGKTIGIRREEQSVWERRAPLSPANVRKLIRQGIRVLIQPSNRRAYPEQAYINAGAIIQEDISDADVILAVKHVPIDQLLESKTYCFFSHTIKAQEANMPLLDALLEKNIRLIDYEKLCDSSGVRLVAFGKYAGVAGMINILHGIGLRLLALGHHTPFMHIGLAHNYRNSGMARQAIRDAGYEISLGMMPKSIGPLTFVFTGSGNVSQGAQEVFQELPYEYVTPEMLHKVAEHGALNKVYACEVSRHDHYLHKGTRKYNEQDYDKNPQEYISTFAKKIAPYTSVLINGIYWGLNSPKLLKIPDAKYLLQPATTPWISNEDKPGSPALPHRMIAIADISADPGGSIEFMNECTTIDNPFCLYDADNNKDVTSFKGPGVLVCSIDNMPTQIPREATDFFGDLLLPLIPDMLQSDANVPLDEHNFSGPVNGAIITSNGKLTPKFEYIADLRKQMSKHCHKSGDAKTKNVLVLGAGFVSAPLVEYLNRGNEYSVTVASTLKNEADILASKFTGVEPVLLDVTVRPDLLEKLIQNSDVVVSLLPFSMHPQIAKACIQHKVNMVTASYCSPELIKMNSAIQEAGITIVNEVGLDPGIDHLLAVETFDEIHSHGGKSARALPMCFRYNGDRLPDHAKLESHNMIESFVSWCGGLPAPEFSDNPLRYKFSWSPRGVLSGVLNPARYLLKNEVVEIEAGGALLDNVQKQNFLPGFRLEGYPNRDSLEYKKLYKIPEAQTVLRGTLRYEGFAHAMKALNELHLINANPHPVIHPKGPNLTWRQLICHLLGQVDPNMFYDNLRGSILKQFDGNMDQLEAVEKLGLLDEVPVKKKTSLLDTLSHYLSKRLAFEKGERDIIILRHEIVVVWADGKRELREINLVIYGDLNGYSGMAKTVGYPAAIATKMILDGEIQMKGLVYPFTPHIYRPMLNRLKVEGISAVEKSHPL